MKMFIRSVTCFMILLIFTGCKPAPSLLLNDIGCTPPCWHNIQPGISTQEDVISILEKLPIVDTKSIIPHGGHWAIFDDTLFFKLKSEKAVGEVRFLNNKVSMIVFSGDMNISFGDAIEKLGMPAYIINIPTYSGPPGLPTTNSTIIAVIPNRGVEIITDIGKLEKALKSQLNPEAKVGMISFFNPADYDKLVDDRFFSEGLLNGSDTRFYMKPWTGYGNIGEKYPPATIH